MAEFIELDDLDALPLRPELAIGVLGQVLLEGPVRVVLTRVEPGGTFTGHRDAYGHLFLTLEGCGEVFGDFGRRTLDRGRLVRIEAGEVHGYANPGSATWVLLTFNLPVAT